MTETVAYSSLKLLFGKCDYWFLNADLNWESSSLPDISYFQSDETKLASMSLFWKNLSSKIYQFDNFNYDGIASIEFEKKLSKFKINFNPRLFYEYVIYSAASDIGIQVPDFTKKSFQSMVDIFEKNKKELIDYGWNNELYQLMIKDQWNNESCWKLWSNIIHKNKYIFDCIIHIFIHEMMHLMWNHVNRMQKSVNPTLFNTAADFAINQNLPFPMPLKKRLVTQFSKFFWPEAQFYFLHYFIKTGDKRVPKNIRNILRDKETFEKNKVNTEIDTLINFNNNSLIHNKNADFYFNIFKEVQESLDLPSKDMNTNNSTGSDEGSQLFQHPNEGKSPTNDELKEDDIDESFDKQIEKIIISKMFRESYEKSEDFKMEHTGGQSEIPFSFAIQEKINQFEKVKKDNRWKKEFNKFLLNYMNAKEKDITMTRSSRKRPDIFPGMRMEIGLDVIFVMDTSGSIRLTDYKQYVGEIVNVSKICNLEKCRIIQCHTQVSSDEKRFSLKKVKSIVFKDTGGTRMRTALEMLRREGNKKPVVIFTDGAIDYFTAEEFKFKILLFVTIPDTVDTLKKRGFKIICPKND